ncbi:hypothetical protein HS088_TW15G00970 [Tripterygium wilfordii]|uniref:Gamma-tubulin complex component 6 n=1 Tax=Tripterygium wilfordii TaxID=458696 RepID=A0A7J7CN21_TRIWF|nr:uncharacterized protein LOC120016944 [Tripterygium wilfordii]KAF5735464.1 hypothetical protein HS088_TW15G00970 [Tripterygium wilfordii]
MAVGGTNFASLFERLKVEDPWLPPSTWESIPSEGGVRFSQHDIASSASSRSDPNYQTSSVSEASVVRLALNALQGVQSALMSIEKLSGAFCFDPADRTVNQIPSLWNRSSSTHAIGSMLNSIGCSGCLVFLLYRFVDHFTNLDLDSNSVGERREISASTANVSHCGGEVQAQQDRYPPYSLVNQAFAIAVRKVLEGYTCALDTLSASVGLRRSSKKAPLHASSGTGCLSSVVHPEVTLLELYLHTKELKTQIEALGSICNLHKLALCFLSSSFEDVNASAVLEFQNFYQGGDLLTYLYTQLQVADPAHCTILKFLFLRSCEPYCGFIRSWIFKAEILDPYKEFFVEYVEKPLSFSCIDSGNSIDFSLASTQERDGVAVPCFFNDFLVPILRAGQQLQVLMKLLEFCYLEAPGAHMYQDFLPSCSGFLGNDSFYASPMILSKKNFEATVIARDSYYRKMQEKLDNLWTKLEFRYHQVVQHGAAPILSDIGARNASDAVSPELDLRTIGDVDSDDSSVKGEFIYQVDTSDLSECSSISDSEVQTDSQLLTENPDSLFGHEQKYFSALRFFISSPINFSPQKSLQCDGSHHVENNFHERCESTCAHDGHSMHFRCRGTLLSNISTPLETGDSCRSHKYDKLCTNTVHYKSWTLGNHLRNPFLVDGNCRDDRSSNQSDTAESVNKRIMKVLNEDEQHIGKVLATSTAVVEDSFVGIQPVNEISISDLSTLNFWKINNCHNPLSMNPMLSRKELFKQTGELGERQNLENGQSLSCFDFSSVVDPCRACDKKLSSSARHQIGPEHLLYSNSNGDCHLEVRNGGDEMAASIKTSSVYSCLKENDIVENVSKNASGGGSWESLLGSSLNDDDETFENVGQSFSTTFEMPLDFIVDKCLLQEILLQYNYVSKLTIKLLEDGFDLQEHLLALRRYHFMEFADWADLFIMSLWHNKWCVAEADQRVSAIQGLLELAIQKSSCEQDHNKNRLFVYNKGDDVMSLAASAIGVHSFDFLGLGYRVDWPVSIVLTPGALKIYADIFSFLIQVKLAVFSLSDVWCCLKEDLRHLISQNHRSAEHRPEVDKLNMLIKMRHQVNHFASTLQQYVQSQLSHVSWCRFLHSLKHKVKDMMDIESAHMAYLTDSLHICFLSDETQSIAHNIASILQCALDFRSCLAEGRWEAGLGQGDLRRKLSRVNVSQVLAIKQKFEKNLRELHLCYRKSPKHGLFGLSHLWGYLNYNEYYSELGNEISFHM